MVSDHIIVALDFHKVDDAIEMFNKLSEAGITEFKVGHWLIGDPELHKLTTKITGKYKLFWDSKLYDIGETVQRGIERAYLVGADYITVHSDVHIPKHGFKDLKILAVTVLSNMDDQSLKEAGYALSLDELIKKRIDKAIKGNCGGVVMAPSDLHLLSDVTVPVGFEIVTPGIRMPGNDHDDHARVGTPSSAIRAGATKIVIGRPIIHARDPVKVVNQIITDIEDGLS